MLHRVLLCLFFGIITTGSGAQIDFNEYRTMLSEGSLPDDFSQLTRDKVREKLINDDSGSKNREFVEQTHYAIDELLHSGFISFGDPISKYVEDIAAKLLRKDRSLRSELRFHTLKSNVSNAFSTDQGIIFVTTGLVSQVSSEAQLAYILAHEICHYTEKHVLESFQLSKKSSRRDWVNKLNQYSREREFEADELALKLYKDAGYTKDELMTTFDVLKYSHLPFDEIEVPQSYFSTERMYIPPSQFPTKAYEIEADDDEDDSNSTHPNISKRKEAVLEKVAIMSNWRDSAFLLGRDRFYSVRNIARFESVRADVIDAQYGDALYSIYMLEQEFPESIYLRRLKAQCWLGLCQYKLISRVNKTIDKTSEYEGSSATVHFFIRKFNKKSMSAMALRQIVDLVRMHPEDSEINAIYERLIKVLAWDDTFDPDNYAGIDFSTAANQFLEDQNDTTKVKEDTQGSSKYDRIKNKENAENPIHFDTLKYYVYGIPDIVTDSSFLEQFESERAAFDEWNEEQDRIKKLSKREREKLRKEQAYTALNIGTNELICVEPKVYSYVGSDVNLVKSEKIEERFAEAIHIAAESSNLTLYPVDNRSIQSTGVQGFNERSLLVSLLSQVANEEDIDVFPVDYQLLLDLDNDYGSANVMFTLVEHSYQPEIRFEYLLYAVLLPPVFLVVTTTHIPIALIRGHHTVLSMIIIDPTDGKVMTSEQYHINAPTSKHILGAHLNDIFSNIQLPVK